MRWKPYAVAGACLTAALYMLPAMADAGPAVAATSSGTAATTSSIPPAAIAEASTAHSAAESGSSTSQKQPAGTIGCAKPADPLAMQCQSFIVKTAKAKAAAKAAVAAAATAKAKGETAADATIDGPLTSVDLQAAYNLATDSASDGTGETVAIVDAYYDPNADSDLSEYRSENDLSACTQASGCLSIYNASGTNLLNNPSADPPLSPSGDNWVPETSLDLDMVSAICPNCKIDLVETTSDLLPAMVTGEDTAVSLGAKFVSDSWSGGDSPGESAYDTYFNHPGVAITVASGDDGYSAGYPASSQYVTSVGGTYLDQDSSGNWTSAVWNDTGSENSDNIEGATAAGCSSGEPEPSWELDASGSTASSDCANRTENDVSAVADAPEGIDIYDSADCDGNCDAYGTSVATPIIAAIYALAGTPTANTYPASYLYQNPQDLTHVTSAPAGFSTTDVVSGGPACESTRQFLCNTADSVTSPASFDGYNGPTGLGTPNGDLTPFKETDANFVSVPNPGSFDFEAGQKVTLPSLGSHTELSGTTLSYSASGLPSGLKLSGDVISGTLSGTPTSASGDTVKVTVTGTKSGFATVKSTISFRITTMKSLTTDFHAVENLVESGVSTGSDFLCMDDDRNSTANGNKVDIYTCNDGASQLWDYVPGTEPGATGTLRIHGKCAAVAGNSTTRGALIELEACDNASGEQWVITGDNDDVLNPHSGYCLNDPSSTTKIGTQLNIGTCSDTTAPEWLLPPSPIQSGVAGKCVNDASSAAGSAISISSCSGSGTQKFFTSWAGTYTVLTIHNECVDVQNNDSTNGSKVVLEPCPTSVTPGELWELTADGTIENAFSQECLADPSNSTTNGTQLVIANCLGQAGEVWADS